MGSSEKLVRAEKAILSFAAVAFNSPAKQLKILSFL
jgi:hypothetical protein